MRSGKPIGTDIVKALENINNTFYLAENDKKQFFIIVSDEFMEIRQIASPISGKRFEIGNYKNPFFTLLLTEVACNEQLVYGRFTFRF